LAPSDDRLLEVDGVTSGYGKKQVLSEVSLAVGAGEAVALLGHNGAGKTTLLRTVVGTMARWRGSVRFAGRALPAGAGPAAAVDLGMAMVPAERFVFPDLSVADNLRLSARGLSAADRVAGLADAFRRFPVLEERAGQRAGTMSGGEQRMVSLSMALMPRPRLLLLDEPSLGLAPVIAEQILTLVRGLVEEGMSVVLVEQNVPAALSVASRVYVLRGGRVLLEERTEVLAARSRETWWELF
jgi:branched-chain amino acid transport system ATP-binding protein